jgi:hypothetical protein
MLREEILFFIDMTKMLYNNIQNNFRHYHEHFTHCHDLLAGLCPGPPLTIPSIHELLTYMLPLKYGICYFVQYPCILNIN